MGRGRELELYRPEQLAPRTKSRGARRLGVIATLTAVTIGTGAWAATGDGPEKDDCTNVNHQLVDVNTQGFKNTVRGAMDLIGVRNDERTITGVAEALSQERGWEISPERLAAVNQKAKFIVRDANGVLQDNLPDGEHCFAIPSPEFSGLYEVSDNDETLTEIADEQDLDLSYMRKLNPQLAKKQNTDVLLPGTTVRVDDEIDTSFALRAMTKEEGNINGMGDIKMRYRILMANVAFMGSGETPIHPGDAGYFPLKGGTATTGKKFGPAEIIATYGHNFTPIDVDNSQIGGKDKKPKIPKPKLPKVKPTTPKKPGNTPERPVTSEIKVGRTISHTTTGAPIPETINGFKYYNQWDERWANKPYNYKKGDGRTVRTSGCGPTSITAVITNLAHVNTNPYAEAKWSKAHGYRAKGGTAHGEFIARPRSVGLHSKEISLSVAAVRGITSKGGMVIVNGEDNRPETPATSAGHIYVVYRVTSEGKFLVLDSNSVSKSMKAWSPNLILGPASAAYGITK